MTDLLTAITAVHAQGAKLLATSDLLGAIGLSCAKEVMPISAIVPSRNEGVRVARTIRSLMFGRSCAFPLEIVVTDDASTDGSCDRLPTLAAESPNVTLVVRRLDEWSGIPFARNRGAEIAHHPIYLITDANTVYPQDWDVPIREHFHPNRILAGTIVDESTGARGYGLSLELPSMGVKWITDPSLYGGYVPVAPCTCTVIDRTLFHQLGGYDESLPLYGAAEPEFSVRAWLSGYEIVNVSDLAILHRFRPRRERERLHASNRSRLIQNYIRFANYYLPEQILKQTRSYFRDLACDSARPCISHSSLDDTTVRRNHLRNSLPRDFHWFQSRFDLSSHGIGASDKSKREGSVTHKRSDAGNVPRIALYTAVVGGYDAVEATRVGSADCFLFTDDPATVAPGWRIVQINASAATSVDDRIRMARRLKALPHLALPDYDVWIWLDGNMSLLVDPLELTRRYLTSSDLATFKYPGERDCLYDEAEACISRNKDDEKIIRAQMNRYRSRDFPKHHGLVETSIVARRNTKSIRAFNEAWWHEIDHGSRRDQLSFNYVAWRLKQSYSCIPGSRTASRVAEWRPHRIDIYSRTRIRPPKKRAADVTIVLLNWMRPQGLASVISSIQHQSVRPRIFLWNNGDRFEHPSVDWSVNSSTNQLCWPRWAMGAMADTEFVCSLDDDFAFGDDRVLEDLVSYLRAMDRPDRLVGASGVILDPSLPYERCVHIDNPPPSDTSVDIVKGKLLACRRDTLRSMAMVAEKREDDIVVSALAARGRPRFHRLPGFLHNRMIWLPEHNLGLSQQVEHNQLREAARRAYFAQ